MTRRAFEYIISYSASSPVLEILSLKDRHDGSSPKKFLVSLNLSRKQKKQRMRVWGSFTLKHKEC